MAVDRVGKVFDPRYVGATFWRNDFDNLKRVSRITRRRVVIGVSQPHIEERIGNPRSNDLAAIAGDHDVGAMTQAGSGWRIKPKML